MCRGLASVKSAPPDVEPSTLHARRSTMAQSSTLFIGMDVHKDTLAVAYVAQEHGAEGSCPRTLRIIPLASKLGTMPPSQPVLEGARPWSHLFFSTNLPYSFSCGSSSCCMACGPSQVCPPHPCQRGFILKPCRPLGRGDGSTDEC